MCPDCQHERLWNLVLGGVDADCAHRAHHHHAAVKCAQCALVCNSQFADVGFRGGIGCGVGFAVLEPVFSIGRLHRAETTRTLLLAYLLEVVHQAITQFCAIDVRVLFSSIFPSLLLERNCTSVRAFCMMDGDTVDDEGVDVAHSLGRNQGCMLLVR